MSRKFIKKGRSPTGRLLFSKLGQHMGNGMLSMYVIVAGTDIYSSLLGLLLTHDLYPPTDTYASKMSVHLGTQWTTE